MRIILATCVVLVAATSLTTQQSDSAKTTRRGSTTVIETSHLLCEIRPDRPKPGVVRCRYKSTGYEVVPDFPKHALLMPEWLLKPGTSRQGIFWAPLKARPKVTVEKGSVVFSVSAKQTKHWNMDVSFRYTPKRDWIDFECRMHPHVTVKDFELFIASYVINDMESTWVSAVDATGSEVFKKLNNRAVPQRTTYAIVRDAKAKKHLSDGRWPLNGKLAGRELCELFYFKRPILIALKESTGLAVITMVDPKFCSLLAGQNHKLETAHDFTFSDNLMPGNPIVCRARIVIRPIGKFPEAKERINGMWEEFVKSLP
jgi:hypothetical protein